MFLARASSGDLLRACDLSGGQQFPRQWHRLVHKAVNDCRLEQTTKQGR